MKTKIQEIIKSRLDELFEISHFLYKNPELGGEEYQAEKLLTDKLMSYGFAVEHGIYGIKTAFKAGYDSNKDGATIAFFCEYDALPDIGHGCGHNLISAMSAGAAVGLKSVVDNLGGKIVVFGTPAEETNGAKVRMAELGAFNGITAAMMVHPSPVSEESGSSLALCPIQFQFMGRTAHAAASPEKGINALDAVILLFNGINALRQHVTSDVRIHGIISKGGVAPNIVPDFAEAKFYFRAGNKDYLSQVVEKVKECARGAALMTGAKVEISKFEESYNDLKTNKTLSNIFTANLLALGEKRIAPPSNGIGSIDMGNVSYVVPAIHPWLGFDDIKLVIHTREFAERTVTEEGKYLLEKGACAMAMTAFDIMSSEEIQNQIAREFELI